MRPKYSGNPVNYQHALRFAIKRYNRYVIIPTDLDACYGWKGRFSSGGYALMSWWNVNMRREFIASRFSYTLTNGPIPEGLNILHTCDNPICTNPRHLFSGTQKDNLLDCLNKRRMKLGEEHQCCKLSDADINDIKLLYQSVKSTVKLSVMYGVSQGHISKIIHGYRANRDKAGYPVVPSS